MFQIFPPSFCILGCSKDIIFVLDDSGSIGPSNFRHAQEFVKAIVTTLDIGPYNSQIGVLVFSSHPQVCILIYINTTIASKLIILRIEKGVDLDI